MNRLSSLQHAALILAGHGSTKNRDSRVPVENHAAILRQRNLFAQVQVCFWKEEPFLRDAIGLIKARRIYIVPVFISQGYYTGEVLPREFKLSGAITERDEKWIAYCDPVGVHPAMTNALLKRAENVLNGEKIDLKKTCLFIAGHGTKKNAKSTRIIYEQVEKISALDLYGECRAFFMEEEPFISNWHQQTQMKNVIVVPFFIADGLHSYEDIPVMLGISHNVKADGFSNPTSLHGRRLWYSRAIGTEPFIVDVILSQIESFQQKHWDQIIEAGS
jgi:sirohydrochlorin cobaltochelatase